MVFVQSGADHVPLAADCERAEFAPCRMHSMACFPASIVSAQFDAQGGCCALCGKRLAWTAYLPGDRGAWHAHHVNGDPMDHRPENCVLLCVGGEERCHLAAHDGNYGGEWVLAGTWFR